MDVTAFIHSSILDVAYTGNAHVVSWNTSREEHSFYRDLPIPCAQLDIYLQGISKLHRSSRKRKGKIILTERGLALFLSSPKATGYLL